MFPYGFPPGYNPSTGSGYNPHHPRLSTGQAPAADVTVSPARTTRARLDGGEYGLRNELANEILEFLFKPDVPGETR